MGELIVPLPVSSERVLDFKVVICERAEGFQAPKLGSRNLIVPAQLANDTTVNVSATRHSEKLSRCQQCSVVSSVHSSPETGLRRITLGNELGDAD